MVIEEDGPLLHIDLGRPIKEWELAAVAHVIRASLPLHVRLWRAHHGHDLRPLAPGSAAGLDADLLDNDSGIPVERRPGPQRQTQSGPTPNHRQHCRPTGVQAAQWLHITTVMTYDDRIVLDAWSLDSALLIDASLGATLVVSSISTAPARKPSPECATGRSLHYCLRLAGPSRQYPAARPHRKPCPPAERKPAQLARPLGCPALANAL